MPDEPFKTRCPVTVYDVTEGKEKKRCRIQMEYAASDIRALIEKGMDRAAVLEHYREWIYDVVRYYILDDWECTDGMEESLAIVDNYIAGYFQED